MTNKFRPRLTPDDVSELVRVHPSATTSNATAPDDQPPRPPELLIPFRPRVWTERALCAQVDPELFFPEKGGSTREAKKVCAACPVQFECLEDALMSGESFGIFGGLSERERRKLRPPKGDVA